MNHYDEKYFLEYQRNIGAFGGVANLFKFEAYIKPDATLLDYGCGGGYLLKHINCQKKYGYDINEVALEEARAMGLEVYSDFEQIPNNLDMVISNHALEHVPSPYDEILRVKQKLKPGGMIVFVTPYENRDQKWDPEDVNKHLYTWSPLNMGNLFAFAGYQILECTTLNHTWPPNYLEIVQSQGWDAFHEACTQYSHETNIKQVKVVARI